MTTIRSVLFAVCAVALLTVACSGAATSPSPVPTTTPTPTPAVPGPVTTPEQALARVVMTEPRLTGIMPLNPDAIGQASWYEVAPASGVGAFVVTVRIGWGDCPAGCINEHRWVYAVAPDGTVSVVSETGDPVPDEAWPGGAAVGPTGIRGRALAGPICPVEKVPPDPACAPRPVVGAVVVVRDASGVEVARTTTGADGSYLVAVAAGRYVVESKPVTGLMGTPGAQTVTVNDGVAATVDLAYDTGIR
jgi:hypothetical protein